MDPIKKIPKASGGSDGPPRGSPVAGSPGEEFACILGSLCRRHSGSGDVFRRRRKMFTLANPKETRVAKNLQFWYFSPCKFWQTLNDLKP